MRNLFLPLFCLLCSSACIKENEASIRAKLESIVKDDLETMVREIRSRDSKRVLDKPYYRIVSYEYFKQSRLFTHKAVVHFYYLKGVKMIQVRKYRYDPSMGQWQRYYKKIEFNLDGSK